MYIKVLGLGLNNTKGQIEQYLSSEAMIVVLSCYICNDIGYPISPMYIAVMILVHIVV
jgi:hypothetical protein